MCGILSISMLGLWLGIWKWLMDFKCNPFRPKTFWWNIKNILAFSINFQHGDISLATLWLCNICVEIVGLKCLPGTVIPFTTPVTDALPSSIKKNPIYTMITLHFYNFSATHHVILRETIQLRYIYDIPLISLITTTYQVTIVEIWDVIPHTHTYRKISNIRRTKSQNFNVSRLGLKLYLLNILRTSVKWRRKM